MSEKLCDTEKDYESGYLHFCKKEEDGKVGVYRAKMARGGKKKG